MAGIGNISASKLIESIRQSFEYLSEEFWDILIPNVFNDLIFPEGGGGPPEELLLPGNRSVETDFLNIVY